MKIRGLILIAGAVAIPLIWFIPLMGRNTEAAFSQYLGAVALILMGIVQLQATRFRGIEAIFGSMDRIYVLHKWLAVVAIAAGYLHSTIDADMGGIEGAWSDAAEDIAELGLNALIFLVIVSLITIIPYKYWKWSHRLIGAFFAMLAFHFVYIEKPFAVTDPAGLYISAFCMMGIASYLYLLLPRFLGVNTRKYRVTAVQQHQNTVEIQLKPEGSAIHHKAGQFAFVNFQPVMLREVHPFTISSAPNKAGDITFMVKNLGGYTKRMGNTLEQGTVAWVSQPFGHFSVQETDRPQVWLGAGIGITPFLAWAESLPDDWNSPAHLYYCVPSEEDAIAVAQLESIAARVKNFEFSLVVSKRDKRLTAERIVNELGGDIKTADVYFCGPTKMRDQLRAGLISRGLRRNAFHYELFEIRDGLGIVKFMQRLLAAVSN